MPIPTLPAAPDPNDPATFNSRAAAWVAALAAWTVAVNSLPAITSTYQFLDGSAAGPSLTFASDTDTGMFRVAANQLGFAVGGVQQVVMSASRFESVGISRWAAASDYYSAFTSFFATGLGTFPTGSLGTYNGNGVDLVSNGYRDTSNLWHSYAAGSQVGAAQISLQPQGYITFNTQTTKNTGDAFAITEAARVFGNQQFGFSDGTASLPGITFTADAGQDTGLFRPTANNIGFALAGVESWRMNAVGGLYGGSPNSLTGIGPGIIATQGITAGTTTWSVSRCSADNVPPNFIFGKTRGTVVDDYTAVVANDFIGRFTARGADGSTTITSARMDFIVEGTPASGDVRGGIRFFTGSGANAVSEALRLPISQAVLAASPTGGLGYATALSVGSTVTQATSRTTAVTLNKLAGEITLFTATGSATKTTFTVNNSLMTAVDQVILCQKSGSDKYALDITAKGAGSFAITFSTDGTASEVVVISFMILRSSAN